MNMEQVQKVAVIMAHPDDEVLGCGGSLSRFSRSGASIHIFILASGLTSRGKTSEVELSELKNHAKLAANRLGAKTIEFGNFPDNSMDSVRLLDIVKKVEKFVTQVEPDVIFTHHCGDINIDHDLTQRAVLTATRPLPGSKPIAILACEVLSSSEFGPPNKRISPHFYIRLSQDDVDAAVDALSCYRGELREWPHPRSKRGLEDKLRLRGAECGCSSAEVFEVLRVVK